MLRIITASGQELDVRPDNTIEFEVENPMFQTEYMPVMFSTSIELLPSDNNKVILGYLPALKMAPTVKTLDVSLILDGIEISSGSLEYEGIQEDTGNLEYTFTERSDNDSWNNKIYTATGIGGCPLIRIVSTAGINPATGKGTIYARNIIPIISLLNKVTNLDYESVTGLDQLYIIATRQQETRYYPESLPDRTYAELIDAVKKLFCMAIFKDRDKYVMKAIKSIFAESSYLDWSGKISDKFSAGRMKKQGYKIAYKNATITPSETASDAQSEGVTAVTKISDMIDGAVMSEYKAYKISQLGGDKYSITMTQAGSWGYYDHIYKRFMDLIEHTGNEYQIDGDEMVDNSPDFKLVECVPIEIFSGSYTQNPIRNFEMYPRIDLNEGERGTDMYIGEYRDGQMVDKRITFPNDGNDNTDGNTNRATEAHDWSMSKVYTRYHNTLASFLNKDKQTISAELNLTAKDLSDFRPWQKIFFASRYWFVTKLNFTLSPRRGIVSCRGDFVER